ncbi:hypothetical protein [Flavobacterium sp. GT3R68]|uniref:hypothetical protein n=1 Tax=Flavobacterium sp. GT3R68 TaxID=2594437 RepID=UPI000F899639|nr:hypothetical protein [Flavobacterium sp. GT3R68]RTY89131.1 hypothetical protein EKL32_24215 [Flavobacterium sp. GSN2]TRW90071.1 hypothetical protein FNW07_11475 [Flavobacterium sp. GT3R68]
MDNELIPERTWWKKNWKWIIPLALFMGVGMIVLLSASLHNEPKHEMAFDKTKWNTKNDMGYAHRNDMLNDLIINKKLKRLKKEEVLEMLGSPERSDSQYLFYKISEKRIGLFPLHVKTLVILISADTTANKVMIHE